MITELVEDKLVACVNLTDNIRSVYWWQGKVEQAGEVLLILKSKRRLLKRIIKTVKSVHSYTVPEIIALPIIDGHKDYLDWIDESTVKS